MGGKDPSLMPEQTLHKEDAGDILNRCHRSTVLSYCRENCL